MKLLFNKGTTGIEQIRQVTGFIDADLEFEKLESSLEIATDELIKIISKPVYEMFIGYFEEDPDEDTNEFELLKKARACVAYRGIALYAPLNDVSFTNQGRTFRTDEHNKAAFEWMIDRSNDSLEKIHYKSLDRLIEALDEHNPTITGTTKWKDTDTYKDSFDALFRTTDEFNEFFQIESRYLLMKLVPGIRKVKLEEITPRVGDSVLQDYMDKLKAGQPVENPILLQAIKAACAYLSLSWAMRRMSATLFPQGPLQAYNSERMSTQAKKVPEKQEVAVVALFFEQDGEKALMKIEELMRPAVQSTDSIESLTNVKLNCRNKFIDT